MEEKTENETKREPKTNYETNNYGQKKRKLKQSLWINQNREIINIRLTSRLKNK